MNRKIYLYFVFLCFYQISFSQSHEKEQKKKAYKFHVIIGGLVSDTYFSFKNETNSETEPGIGIAFGVGSDIDISKKIYITTDYLLRLRRSKDIYFDNNFDLYYLSIPLGINLRIDKWIDFSFGPQFEIVLFTNGDHRDRGERFSHSIEHRNIGVHVGPIFNLSEKSGVAIKYFAGLNNIGIDYNNLYRELRVRSIGVRYIYKF